MIVAINIAIIILEIIGFCISISERKWTILAYYTQISNIVTLVSSAALVAAGSTAASVTLRYLSSCMLTMTFLITLCVLVPMGGGFRKLMLSGNGLYHHTLCPILSVGSYIMLEEHAAAWLLPTAVTFIYGIIMLILNGLERFDGPYPFFRVRQQSRLATVVWMAALTGVIAAISIGMTLCAPAGAGVPQGNGGETEMNNGEMLEFTRITLSISGSTASTREYEVLRTKSGMEAALYDGSWDYDETVSRESCRVGQGSWGQSEYGSLARKLAQLGVESWDGFNESNPKVLDGYMFSLEIELADGRVITAHGSNSYPDNYNEFRNLLEEAVFGPKEY